MKGNKGALAVRNEPDVICVLDQRAVETLNIERTLALLAIPVTSADPRHTIKTNESTCKKGENETSLQWPSTISGESTEDTEQNEGLETDPLIGS